MSDTIDERVAENTAAIVSLNTATAGLTQAQANIEAVIPSQASVQNKLADKDFVNSTLNSLVAFYITADAAGNPFASRAALMAATEFYSGGVLRTPTRNDYCLVLADETHATGSDVPSTRYIYDNGWQFQFVVNSSGLTAAQYAAVMSGITGLAAPTPGAAAGVAALASAVWSHIWGTLLAMPTGYSSLYDFLVSSYVPFKTAVPTALTTAQKRQFAANIGGVYLDGGKLYDGAGNEIQVGGGSGNMKIWSFEAGNMSAGTFDWYGSGDTPEALPVAELSGTPAPGDLIHLNTDNMMGSWRGIKFKLKDGSTGAYGIFVDGSPSIMSSIYDRYLYVYSVPEFQGPGMTIISSITGSLNPGSAGSAVKELSSFV